MGLKLAGEVANNVDLDQIPTEADLGLQCLLRPVCLNIFGMVTVLKFCTPRFPIKWQLQTV